jgi:hypothetical protein
MYTEHRKQAHPAQGESSTEWFTEGKSLITPMVLGSSRPLDLVPSSRETVKKPKWHFNPETKLGKQRKSFSANGFQKKALNK